MANRRNHHEVPPLDPEVDLELGIVAETYPQSARRKEPEGFLERDTSTDPAPPAMAHIIRDREDADWIAQRDYERRMGLDPLPQAPLHVTIDPVPQIVGTGAGTPYDDQGRPLGSYHRQHRTRQVRSSSRPIAAPVDDASFNYEALVRDVKEILGFLWGKKWRILIVLIVVGVTTGVLLHVNGRA